ncbi:hypothetical protein BCF44_109149 [Kutzneria buriramensis]|uniref:Uncharacterized protein n=1 Tax=Kutzneria buriramensis TaxID=1045776 RepID=A0A3E0HEX9_9PSEU|nr:hypothetical protein BCF44_109149 [Kutzneria buriramensis]
MALRGGVLSVALVLTVVYGYGFTYDLMADPSRPMLAWTDLVRSLWIISCVVAGDLLVRDAIERKRRRAQAALIAVGIEPDTGCVRTLRPVD